jgi:hypothetical protein
LSRCNLGQRAFLSIERRSFEGAGRDRANAAGAPAQDGLAGEKGEGEPDQNECDQVSTRKWFMVKENAEKKRADRRKILEEADRNEAKMSGGLWLRGINIELGDLDPP